MDTPATPPVIPDASRTQVLIVGAGPVGLFLALKLAQKGIKVKVLECESKINESPRAATYMPIVLNEFEKVGILDDLLARSLRNTDGIYFRTPFAKGDQHLGTLSVAKLPKGVMKYDFVATNLGQHDLGKLLLEHAEKLETFEISWNHRFAGVQQDANGTKICAVTPTGERFFQADYVVGCDGAGSSVRRALCIPFDGFTWQDYRFVATNVIYPFDKFGYGVANMLVDKEDWAVVAQLNKSFWRVAYGEPAHLSEHEILKRLPAKYERLLPGPRPLKYELVSANPYWAHQRVAANYRVDRVVLCGDAAHSNNPVGGLGLTTGHLDAASLGNCLIRIIVEKETDELLSRYAKVRREAFVNVTNPESIGFKYRVSSMEPQHIEERGKFFEALNNDPEFHNHVAKSMAEVFQDFSSE